jgi:hypothetical protein
MDDFFSTVKSPRQSRKIVTSRDEMNIARFRDKHVAELALKIAG